MNSFYAELLLLGKRSATWILLGAAILSSLFFPYVLPYVSYLSNPPAEQTAPGRLVSVDLQALLPERFVSSLLGGFPFYLGMLTLILGVLMFGSEYGWGTLKTSLMQRPDRVRWLLTKLGALGTTVALFTIAVFAAAAISSTIIALVEDAAVSWPPISEIIRGLGAGWLILTLWAVFGAVLAILSRGTALAIGLGILWGLVIEGVISGFGVNVGLLQGIAQGFLRTNSYSLVAPMRVADTEVGGPGAFAGPFVDAWQALVVIIAYLIIFSTISALVLRRRDVT